MAGPEIYLDNSATTQVDEDVAEVACRMMVERYGNPSSLHYLGSQAYQSLNIARNQVAQVLGARTDRVCFTSGGTEGNSLLLTGVLGPDPRGKKLVVTAIEHSSVLEAAARLEELGCQVERVRPGPDGRIRARDVAAAVDGDTALVSAMTVNNETGELLPIREIVDLVREKNPRTLIHTDFVQGFGKTPVKVWETGVHLLTLSGHKLHAPKGIGAVYIKEGLRVLPLQRGGRQEGGVRPGTENVPLACALGAAAYKSLTDQRTNGIYVKRLRDRLLGHLERLPGAVVNSPGDGSPYLLNFSLPGLSTDYLVTELSRRRIYLSGGSACARGERSHVLLAMGLPPERVASALRVSFSHYNTPEEIDILGRELTALALGGRPPD